MPLEINRPGDSAGEKPRLSSFGKRVVALALVLALVATMLIYSRIQAGNRKAELAEQVLAAVDRSKIVCTNALSAVGAGDEARAALQAFLGQIEGGKQVADKAAAAQEMITYCLSQVQGN
ncbi:MAG: hypothetical protein Q8P31_02485, partial [Bacillota bacterium]|nr:hypothetical protein [Bacillota bacterium]